MFRSTGPKPPSDMTIRSPPKELPDPGKLKIRAVATWHDVASLYRNAEMREQGSICTQRLMAVGFTARWMHRANPQDMLLLTCALYQYSLFSEVQASTAVKALGTLCLVEKGAKDINSIFVLQSAMEAGLPLRLKDIAQAVESIKNLKVRNSFETQEVVGPIIEVVTDSCRRLWDGDMAPHETDKRYVPALPGTSMSIDMVYEGPQDSTAEDHAYEKARKTVLAIKESKRD